MASDFTAVCEPGQASSDIWDSPSGEAGRATGNNSALERKTVRSGVAYDINGGGCSAESSERARRLKEELGSVPVSGIENRVAYRFAKRAFDIVFSAAVFVVFCWLFAIIAILVKVDDPKGPVFFSQERVGWSIIGQKSEAASAYVLRPALSALEVPSVCHSQVGLGLAA